MKKFVIIYTIISVLLLVVVTLVASYNHYYSRVIDVYQDVSSEASDTGNFDTLVGIQTQGYQKVIDQVNGDYQFIAYIAIGSNEGIEINQLSIFIRPITDVSYAQTIDDTNDQSDVIFTNDQNALIYSLKSDEAYADEAVSYGIHTIGFYYAVFELGNTQTIQIEVLDYDGLSILDTSYQYNEVLTLESPNVSPAVSDEVFADLVDFNTYVRPEILKTVLIFITVDIALGAGLYFYRTKSKKL